MAWSTPLAVLLDASIAACRGQRDRAAELCEAAAKGFDAAGMLLHAAAARRRQGALLEGDKGAALIARADAWMATQAIKNPTRMTAMLAPS
jgi:hypothetical protein